MSHYSDRTILVTGASEGIGRALCLALAAQRPRLVLAARNRGRLEELAAECGRLGAQTLVVPTDVTDPDACKALVEAAVARFGGIDAVVANAGGTMWTRFDEVEDLGLFERLMRLNYLGSLYPTYYALPQLKRTRGQLVAIASVAGLVGVPTRTGYSAAKHALIAFCDALRVELRGSGVAVTVVCPDFVVSQIHRRALGADGRPLESNPLAGQKIMSAEECAARIVAAMQGRRRMVVTSARGKLARWLRLVAPGLLDRMAARAIPPRE
jgi:short-subunit dehydrogenase